MKIFVIGGGGREHALIWKLKQSTSVDRIFCAPGNAGTAAIAENVAIAASDLPQLRAFAKQNVVDLTVVGPDEPLASGIVDLLMSDKLRVFGPTKSAARLESSKIFAKELMRAQKIQGVIIAPNIATARSTIEAMLNQARFGDAGRRIVIEEFLRGTECSLHALVDGKNYQLLESARDYKRAFDGDEGPNTGGMGAFSPADNWDARLQSQFESEIMQPLLRGLSKEGIAYRGLLYPGLMITSDGARVLEFNCRFGDPETQALLPRMKSDLLPLLEATIDGKIDNYTIDWDKRAAITVVVASAGYPGKYETEKAISGLDEAAKLEDIQVFHAGTKNANNQVITAGGRVLAVTALGATIAAARSRAYEAVSLIQFDGCHYRRDIALNAVTS